MEKVLIEIWNEGKVVGNLVRTGSKNIVDEIISQMKAKHKFAVYELGECIADETFDEVDKNGDEK